MQARRRRAFALTAGGAFAVHQIRYLVAYGHDSGHRLADQGHAYLTPLLGVAALFLGLGMGAFLLRLARGGRSPAGPRTSLARGWASAGTSLVALYCFQESLEGLLERGHPAGLTGVFGGGGWLAVPLSVAIGLLIALALRGAEAAVELAARPAPRSLSRRELQIVIPRPVAWSGPVCNVVARHLAGRAPPPASV